MGGWESSISENNKFDELFLNFAAGGRLKDDYASRIDRMIDHFKNKKGLSKEEFIQKFNDSWRMAKNPAFFGPPDG